MARRHFFKEGAGSFKRFTGADRGWSGRGTGSYFVRADVVISRLLRLCHRCASLQTRAISILNKFWPPVVKFIRPRRYSRGLRVLLWLDWVT